jgi:hypothetical protein
MKNVNKTDAQKKLPTIDTEALQQVVGGQGKFDSHREDHRHVSDGRLDQ